MAFKRDYQPAGVEYVQQQKKRLPYTVTDIGGPAELAHWKAEQKRIEQEWLAAKEKRKQEVIQAMNDGSLAKKEFGESETTKAYKRFAANQVIQEQQAILAKLAKVDTSGNLALKSKPSIFTRIYNWCLEKFLSINL